MFARVGGPDADRPGPRTGPSARMLVRLCRRGCTARGGAMASDGQNGQKWPDRLWIVRHGQSEANVARRLAEEAAREEIDISVRDVDAALSALGREQALAVGRWLGELPPEARPNVVLTSPYQRAIETARLIR